MRVPWRCVVGPGSRTASLTARKAGMRARPALEKFNVFTRGRGAGAAGRRGRTGGSNLTESTTRREGTRGVGPRDAAAWLEINTITIQPPRVRAHQGWLRGEGRRC